MNVISRILDEPSVSRGDYVFDSDHMFFSDYSKRLADTRVNSYVHEKKNGWIWRIKKRNKQSKKIINLAIN